MKYIVPICVFLTLAPVGRAEQAKPAVPPAATPPATAVESETIKESLPTPAARTATAIGEGMMDPAQVKELLHRIWLAGFRISDLLTEVRPERWKLDDTARNSFNETLATLRRQLEALDAWRAQFDARPDDAYLAFEIYTAIGAVLPRLDGVGRSVSRHMNPSLGAQFSQAGNQLFDLQQALQPYLTCLLRNQDQVLQALQTNLATCQTELSFAMRGRSEPAKPMKNIRPDFKGRRQRSQVEGAPASKVASPTIPLPGKPSTQVRPDRRHSRESGNPR